MKPLFRITLTLLAIILGGVFVYALTFVGEKTQGPIEDALTSASDIVRGAEEKMILNNRTDARLTRLSWLNRTVAEARNPSKILLGAFDDKANVSLKTVFELEQNLRTTFPLVQVYSAWGNKEEQKFPKILVESIIKSGSIPVITWEPWLTDFDATLFPAGLRSADVRDKNGLNDVANGVYDSYIRSWAKAAAQLDCPIYLRFGHEMNDPYRYPWGPQNNRAEDFVAAWRHVYGVFQEENARNVIWVWSPHPAHGWFEAYYPGDEFVDWVGVGVLNYGTVAPTWSQWWSFDEIFGKYYADLASFEKPVMISEFASLAVGGDRAKWYADALTDLPIRYPRVRGLLFFHVLKDQTTTQQPLDWTINHDSSIVQTIADRIKMW